MARDDIAAGKIKKVKGKLNNVIGAVRGKPSQQLKGKMQEVAGKLQEEYGKVTARRHPSRVQPAQQDRSDGKRQFGRGARASRGRTGRP